MTKNENHIKKNHENAFFKHFLGCFYFMLNLWSYLQNVSSINIIYNHSIHSSGLKFNLKIPNIAASSSNRVHLQLTLNYIYYSLIVR